MLGNACSPQPSVATGREGAQAAPVPDGLLGLHRVLRHWTDLRDTPEGRTQRSCCPSLSVRPSSTPSNPLVGSSSRLGCSPGLSAAYPRRTGLPSPHPRAWSFGLRARPHSASPYSGACVPAAARTHLTTECMQALLPRSARSGAGIRNAFGGHVGRIKDFAGKAALGRRGRGPRGDAWLLEEPFRERAPRPLACCEFSFEFYLPAGAAGSGGNVSRVRWAAIKFRERRLIWLQLTRSALPAPLSLTQEWGGPWKLRAGAGARREDGNVSNTAFATLTHQRKTVRPPSGRGWDSVPQFTLQEGRADP